MQSASVSPPSGECWCGCSDTPSEGKHFVANHDRTAEAAVIKVEYGSIAAFLQAHGYGPGCKNAIEERKRLETGA